MNQDIPIGQAGMVGDKMSQSDNPRTKSPIEHPTEFEKELIVAFQQELGQLRSQVYKLEDKVRRYDRAFESMFREELDSRINSKTTQENTCAMEVSPLERLKYLNKR